VALWENGWRPDKPTIDVEPTLGITSPPFLEGRSALRQDSGVAAEQQVGSAKEHRREMYGAEHGQLGAMNEGSFQDPDNQTGETFWSASRQILEQLFEVIQPGGHAVFVVKNFVRDGKEVDFTGQWAKLAEAVGFRWLHHHRALLVEVHGEQARLDGSHDVIKTERKSFFRRLAEDKGSPRIDHESVLCFEKP
jgi:hypothetical protein